ncbi:YrhK family protein [Halioxenophilus aromaticivorans]|uniref:YrhK family protein n=1 Tax=Halioxenophilus aromaticivorans TaxID=1306992 RepID=UPI0031E7C30C
MPNNTVFSPSLTDVLYIVSSLCFFFGSVCFLPRFAAVAEVGVWLFMLGSLLMLVGATLACKKPRS